MTISENKDAKDTKAKKKGKAPETKLPKTAYPLNNWVKEILANSDEEHASMITKYHDTTVVTIMRETGKIESEATEMYQRIYGLLLDKTGHILTEDMKVVFDYEVQLYYPEEGLKFNREKKQYRRNRKKINQLNIKTIIDIVTHCDKETEGNTELTTFKVRKSAESNPDRDREVKITALIDMIIVELNHFTNPKLNENYTIFVEEFYDKLLDNIASFTGKVYGRRELIAFIENDRKEVELLANDLYKRIYEKAGVELSKSPTKGNAIKFSVTKEHDKVREMYKSKDSTIIQMLDRLDYLSMTNVV